MKEECVPDRYYTLIPYRDRLVNTLLAAGLLKISEVKRLSDAELVNAGLPDNRTVALFRRYLTIYEPSPAKIRELESSGRSPEEMEMYRELYDLPGVKATRAELYILSGYDRLEKIAAASAEDIYRDTKETIDRLGLPLKAPLLKEVRTHIASAKAFTGAER